MTDKKTPAQIAAEKQAAAHPQTAPAATKPAKAAKEAKPVKTAEELKAEKDAAAAAAKAKKDAENAAKLKEKIEGAAASAREGLALIVAATEAAHTSFVKLGESPAVEQIKTTLEGAAIHLKDSKAALRTIKTAVRVSKDANEVVIVQAEALGHVEKLERNIASAKKLVSEAKEREKAEEKARKEAEREASKMPIKNDVRQPKPGTACAGVWDLIDKISAQLGQPAPVSYVMQYGIEREFDENTLKTQYARWKKFHGIEGRVTAPAPKLDI